jgi:hypothetical protein
MFVRSSLFASGASRSGDHIEMDNRFARVFILILLPDTWFYLPDQPVILTKQLGYSQGTMQPKDSRQAGGYV